MSTHDRSGQGPMGRLGQMWLGLVAVLALAFVVSPALAQQEPARVYTFTLDGWFGKDVSQTPIAEALEDARQQKADYIIITVDCDWHQFGDPLKSEKPEDVIGEFDQFFRTKAMAPLFQEKMLVWEKKPKVVFWVKEAMAARRSCRSCPTRCTSIATAASAAFAASSCNSPRATAW